MDDVTPNFCLFSSLLMLCLVWKMEIAAEPWPSCGARCPRLAPQVLLLTRVLWGFVCYGISWRYPLELGLFART